MRLAPGSRPWTTGARGEHLFPHLSIHWKAIPDGLSCFVLPVWGEDTLAQPGCPCRSIIPHFQAF